MYMHVSKNLPLSSPCRHFDTDRSGKLEHQEFKSCLRSLGYDIALMEGGETDPEFEAILDQVDPNRYYIMHAGVAQSVECTPGLGQRRMLPGEIGGEVHKYTYGHEDVWVCGL